jgi:predicted ATP-dependent endonuclease of OLD family
MTQNGRRKQEGRGHRFARLYLENWRNFQQADLKLQRRVFLVGPNASGKSNLLDVFRFLHDIVSVGGGFQQAVKKRGGVSALRCLAARQNPDIVIRVELLGEKENDDTSSYELRFAQDKLRRPLIKEERVTKNNVEILRRPNPEDQADPERRTQTYLEQVNVNRDFRDVAEFFSSVRYLHIVPQLVREPDRSVGNTMTLMAAIFSSNLHARQTRHKSPD